MFTSLSEWKSFSRVRLFATPWTVQSLEFSRLEYWSGRPFPSPGDLPNPGIEPRSPALQADSLSTEPRGKPSYIISICKSCFPCKCYLKPLVHFVWVSSITSDVCEFKQAHMNGNMPCSSHLTGSTLHVTGECLTLELRGHISGTLYIKSSWKLVFSFISVLQI